MDFKAAFEKHSQWKIKFRQAISEKNSTGLGAVGSDKACELGTWLGSAECVPFRGMPAFAELTSAHQAFHREAGLIADAIVSKRFEKAKQLLDGPGYAKATDRVWHALIACQCETKKVA